MPDTDMIAVDTSALMAILLDEPDAERCIAALTAHSGVLISAGTLAECLIVAARRNVGDEMVALLDGFGFEMVSVTPAAARRISEAYSRWGKGIQKAVSTSKTALLMRWPRSMIAHCSTSVMISPVRILPAHFSPIEPARRLTRHLAWAMSTCMGTINLMDD
jgi:ribonuclease VapC